MGHGLNYDRLSFSPYPSLPLPVRSFSRILTRRVISRVPAEFPDPPFSQIARENIQRLRTRIFRAYSVEVSRRGEGSVVFETEDEDPWFRWFSRVCGTRDALAVEGAR